jgi:hypothetical protein
MGLTPSEFRRGIATTAIEAWAFGGSRTLDTCDCAALGRVYSMWKTGKGDAIMTTDLQRIENLCARLEKVETHSRRTKLMLGMGGAALVVVFMLGADKTWQPRRIEANEFVVVDQDGVRCATFGLRNSPTGEKVAALYFFDDKNREIARAAIANDRGGWAVSVHDKSGIGRGRLQEVPDGVFLLLTDGLQGQAQVALEVTTKGPAQGARVDVKNDLKRHSIP